MRLLCSLGMVLVLCTRAAAQSPPEQNPPHATAVEQARQLYEQGMAHYQLGEYDDAISRWQDGFRIKPVPELLYNLGQAYRLSRRPRKALQSYNAYLRMLPKAPNRASVERYIVALQKIVDENPNAVDPPLPSTPAAVQPVPLPAQPAPPEVAPTVVATPSVDLTVSAPPRKKPLTHKAWFWVAVSSGVAVVAAGVAVGVVLGTRSTTKTLPELSF